MGNGFCIRYIHTVKSPLEAAASNIFGANISAAYNQVRLEFEGGYYYIYYQYPHFHVKLPFSYIRRTLNKLSCGLCLRAASNIFGNVKNWLRLQFKGVFYSRAASNGDFTVCNFPVCS